MEAIEETISEAELEDIQKMLEAFRPVAERLLTKELVNPLMSYMANVIHSEFFSEELRLPWPDYVTEDDREAIRNSIRDHLNSLIAKRFMCELQRFVAST